MPTSITGSGLINGLALPTDSIKPGFVHLHTETFSAVSSVSIDDVFSAEYDSYEAIVSSLFPSATGNSITLNMRGSGSDYTSSNYWYATEYIRTDNTTTRGSGAPQSYQFITITSAASAGYISTNLRFIGPYTATATRINSESFGYSAGNNAAINSGGSVNAVNSFDGFKLSVSSGTMSGTIRIYGYRNT